MANDPKEAPKAPKRPDPEEEAAKAREHSEGPE